MSITLDHFKDLVLDGRITTDKTLAAGVVTETVKTFAGTQLVETGRTVTTISADRLTTTVQSYLGTSSAAETKAERVTAADGSVTETTWQYGHGGATLLSKVTKVTSSNGLVVTTRIDRDGDGDNDLMQTATTALNSNGTRVTTTDTHGGTSPTVDGRIDREIVSTSANGLSIKTQTHHDVDFVADARTNEITIYNASGSTTSASANYDGSETSRFGKTATTISDDGLSKTTYTYLGSDSASSTRSWKPLSLAPTGPVSPPRRAPMAMV